MMQDGSVGGAMTKDLLDVDRNGAMVLRLFDAYYHFHHHSGKIYEDFPAFFLLRPEAIEGKVTASRSSEKLSLEDCVQRAKARNGYISVSKHRNPKLGYYWLELSVMPFMMGDPVGKENKGEFFYILTKFIEFTKQNPAVYGDLTAEIESDNDIALMLDGIGKMANRLETALLIYPEEMLVSYDPRWPASEVQKLMQSLKDNDQGWCALFFEYLRHVMSKKN
jgi:hypothetical protein